MRGPRVVLVLTLVLALSLAISGGCSSDDGGSATTTSAPAKQDSTTTSAAATDEGDTHDANPDAQSTVEVVAVKRSTTVMNELADAFESENPDIGVQISYAERSRVASVVDENAAAVAVNETSLMADLEATEVAPVDLGADPMQIVVPTGNPAAVQDVTVFGDSEVVTGVCAGKIPCGVGAEEVFAAAALDADPDETFETGDELIAQVRSADLDAGLLRRTQGASVENPKWEIVTLPDEISAPITYQVALVASPPEAQTFVTWLTESETAQEILVSFGLQAP